MNIEQIIKEELQAALDENTESPYYAEQARLGKIRQMGHDDAVAGKEPSSTMAIYRVGYQAGMKSKKEKPMSKYDFFKENKMNKDQLKQLIKEELAALAEGGRLQNTAKGAAMALLHMAKVMEQSPSHEPASLYAQEVAKQANLIMDMLVQMEDDEAGRNPGGSIGEAAEKD